MAETKFFVNDPKTIGFIPTEGASYDKSFDRISGQPLDKKEVWDDLEKLKAYAKSVYAYVGQKVAYIDENKKVKHFSIDADGELKPLGGNVAYFETLNDAESAITLETTGAYGEKDYYYGQEVIVYNKSLETDFHYIISKQDNEPKLILKDTSNITNLALTALEIKGSNEDETERYSIEYLNKGLNISSKLNGYIENPYDSQIIFEKVKDSEVYIPTVLRYKDVEYTLLNRVYDSETGELRSPTTNASTHAFTYINPDTGVSATTNATLYLDEENKEIRLDKFYNYSKNEALIFKYTIDTNGNGTLYQDSMRNTSLNVDNNDVNINTLTISDGVFKDLTINSDSDTVITLNENVFVSNVSSDLKYWFTNESDVADLSKSLKPFFIKKAEHIKNKKMIIPGLKNYQQCIYTDSVDYKNIPLKIIKDNEGNGIVSAGMCYDVSYKTGYSDADIIPVVKIHDYYFEIIYNENNEPIALDLLGNFYYLGNTRDDENNDVKLNYKLLGTEENYSTRAGSGTGYFAEGSTENYERFIIEKKGITDDRLMSSIASDPENLNKELKVKIKLNFSNPNEVDTSSSIPVSITNDSIKLTNATTIKANSETSATFNYGANGFEMADNNSGLKSYMRFDRDLESTGIDRYKLYIFNKIIYIGIAENGSITLPKELELELTLKTAFAVGFLSPTLRTIGKVDYNGSNSAVRSYIKGINFNDSRTTIDGLTIPAETAATPFRDLSEDTDFKTYSEIRAQRPTDGSGILKYISSKGKYYIFYYANQSWAAWNKHLGNVIRKNKFFLLNLSTNLTAKDNPELPENPTSGASAYSYFMNGDQIIRGGEINDYSMSIKKILDGKTELISSKSPFQVNPGKGWGYDNPIENPGMFSPKSNKYSFTEGNPVNPGGNYNVTKIERFPIKVITGNTLEDGTPETEWVHLYEVISRGFEIYFHQEHLPTDAWNAKGYVQIIMGRDSKQTDVEGNYKFRMFYRIIGYGAPWGYFREMITEESPTICNLKNKVSELESRLAELERKLSE